MFPEALGDVYAAYIMENKRMQYSFLLDTMSRSHNQSISYVQVKY